MVFDIPMAPIEAISISYYLSACQPSINPPLNYTGRKVPLADCHKSDVP